MSDDVPPPKPPVRWALLASANLVLLQTVVSGMLLVWSPAGDFWDLMDAATTPLLALPGLLALGLVAVRHDAARLATIAALALFLAQWFAATSLASSFTIFVFGAFGQDPTTLRLFAYGFAPFMLLLNGGALYALLKEKATRGLAAADPWAESLTMRRWR